MTLNLLIPPLQRLFGGSGHDSLEARLAKNEGGPSMQESYEGLVSGLLEHGYTFGTFDGKNPTLDVKLSSDFVDILIETHPGAKVLTRYGDRHEPRGGYRMFPLWALYDSRSLETVLNDRPDGVMIVDTGRRLQTTLLRKQPFPFEVSLDGKAQQLGTFDSFENTGYTGQEELKIAILPGFGQMPEFQQFSDLQVTLFKTPLSYILLEDPLKWAVLGQDKQFEQVDMGDLPHLMGYNQKDLHIHLERGYSYDLLIMDRKKDGSQNVAFFNRFTTGEDQPPYVPTPEEMKYLAIAGLGLSPQEARGINARVKIMGAFTQTTRGVHPVIPTGNYITDHHYGYIVSFGYLTPSGSEAGFSSHVQDTMSTVLVGNVSLKEIRPLIGRS